MKIYRGDNTRNFKVNKRTNSRYGFPALFFSTKVDLARLYAEYKALDGGDATVYKFDTIMAMPSVDFNGKESYSGEFVDLIHRLKGSGAKAVRITNVFDYPSQDFKGNNNSDIVAIFDFSVINGGSIIE
jgi:hypothetical protein